MKLAAFRCDYCQIQKGETNAWWLRYTGVGAFFLIPWDDAKANSDDHEHICSDSCASKALSKWMAR